MPLQQPTILVFDPAEAAPEPGLAPDPMVRLYDPGAPLDPWTVREWRYIQLARDSRATQEALEKYSTREERRQRALRSRRQKQERARRAAEYERQRLETVERQRLQQLELDERRAAQAAQERERLTEHRAREELKQSRLVEAHRRHRDAPSADDELEVFELGSVGPVRLRIAALLDSGAKPAPDCITVFCPAHPEGPFIPLDARQWKQRTTLRGRRARHLIARYRSWQAEERRIERLANLTREFESALDKARSVLRQPVENEIPLCDLPLTRNDLRLAMVWCRGDDRALYMDLLQRLQKHAWKISGLRQEFESIPSGDRRRSMYLLTRMLSARLAEVAVREFYQQRDPALNANCRQIVDMSIRQVTGKKPFDHRYDLAYPDRTDACSQPPHTPQDPPRKIDVKNARVRPGNPEYTRHYVKRLRTLPDDTTVTIVGTVSEVGKLIHLLRRSPGDGHVRILGETDRAKVEELERRYQHAILKLSLTRAGREGQFFPPWMFDAPPFTVAERARVLDRLKAAYSACAEHSEAREEIPIPLAIAAGIPITDAQASRLSSCQRELVRELQGDDLRRKSLPHLYLTVLREFFSLLSAPDQIRAEYHPDSYREILFFEGIEASPLGIPDPLKSVASLLSSLSHLLRYGWQSLLQFESFEFQQSGVLYGWKRDHPDDRWTLMFTHCGNRRECGGTHLVVGRESLCSSCRHLICRTCNYCQDGCGDNMKGLDERGSQGPADAGRNPGAC